MKSSDILSYIANEYPIILDIGSYNGRDSKIFADYFLGRATIFAFEADPRACKLWLDNVPADKYQEIALEEKAVGNINGRVTFNVADKNATDFHCSGSLAKPKGHLRYFPSVKFDGTFEVDCIRLDDWIASTIPDTDIDLIWMDVNGAELQAIEGGINTFSKRTKLLVTEFSNHELYEGQISKEKILELLPSYEVIQEEYHNQHGFGDLLLRNKFFD